LVATSIAVLGGAILANYISEKLVSPWKVGLLVKEFGVYSYAPLT